MLQLQGEPSCAQAQLKKATAPKLKAAVPAIDDDMLTAMKKSPMRVYDPQIVQDPLVYRLTEVCCAQSWVRLLRLLANGQLTLGPLRCAGTHALRRGTRAHASACVHMLYDGEDGH